MGNLIVWDRPSVEADYRYAKLYRSNNEAGPYELIATIDIDKSVYYDHEGADGHWYKLKFVGDNYESDFSEPFKGQFMYVYCEVDDVLRYAGLSMEVIKDQIKEYMIWKWIYEVGRMLDKYVGTVYGRKESFVEYFDSKYLDLGRIIRLPYKYLDRESIRVFYRSGEDSWYELRYYYDYEVLEEKGWIRLYRVPIMGQFRGYRDIRVEGSYGVEEVPSEIKQLTAILTAIRIFVNLTGGSFDDVTSYSMGGVSYSLGEPYVNMRETIKILEKEKERLMKMIGLDLDEKVDFRM